MTVSDHINTLAAFCGRRDLPRLSAEALFGKYGIRKADVFVLFGGSILAGGDVLAQAIRDKIADKYVIVGGAGHTTETLRERVRAEYPEMETAGLAEAEIFQMYLQRIHDCQADYLETESTNCGNNITFLIDLLDRNKVSWKSIILCQDASMQNRMDAGLRKYAPEGTTIINFAAYSARLQETDGQPEYTSKIHGMWEIDRYVNLLMGEIPRLSDNPDGYGPCGRGFIAHVDIPAEVLYSFDELKKIYGGKTRTANPAFADKPKKTEET